MNSEGAEVETERVIKIRAKQGASTLWLIECPDRCTATETVKPISRQKAIAFAHRHIMVDHRGEGSIRTFPASRSAATINKRKNRDKQAKQSRRRNAR